MGRTLVGGSASSPGSWNWVVCSTEMGLVLNDSAGCRPPSPAPARHCPIAANGARAHVWDCSVAPSLPGFTPFPSLSRPCLLSSRLSLSLSLSLSLLFHRSATGALRSLSEQQLVDCYAPKGGEGIIIIWAAA